MVYFQTKYTIKCAYGKSPFIFHSNKLMGLMCLLSYWKIETEVKILKQEKKFNIEYVTILQK